MRGFALLAWGLTFVSIGCGGPDGVSSGPSVPAPAPSGAVTPPPPKQHPVVVAIVIDQLAGWVAKERFGDLPASGGFARLRREGRYASDVRFSHAICATAAGHSALFSGAVPRDSGVTHNGALDAASGKFISILADPTARLVTAAGTTEEIASSIAVLKVDTVADRLRSAHPNATIVSLSLKDRGAIFGGGRHPTATLWYDASSDGPVTSTAFADQLPSWTRDATSAATLRATVWEPTDRAWLDRVAKAPDDGAGEGDYHGLGRVFPHDVAHAEVPTKAFNATPYADEWVLGLARAALAAPREDGPLLLALSLSANDYIGHVFGPMSREAFDGLLRLDRALADLFAELDRRFGADGWAAILGSDHGVGPMPETAAPPGTGPCMLVPAEDRARCGEGKRILAKDFLPPLNRAASEAVGPGKWVLGISEPYIVLTDEARKLPPKRRSALKAAVIAAAKKQDTVRDVYDVQAIPTACPPLGDESVAALVCRSVIDGQGGELYVVTQPGSFFDVGYTPGEGSNHGTQYLYDRSIPVFVRAPGRVPAGQRVDTPLDVRVYARTLADLIGVDPPVHAQGGESLAASAR